MSNTTETGNGRNSRMPDVDLTLQAKAERHLIRPGGSHRHVDFHVRVGQFPPRAGNDRMPLKISLVLDRSGSMQGDKIKTAKRAALSVLDRLEERDEVAVVVFDDHIDLLQPAAHARAEVKDAVRRALAAVDARASTALHEGWLTGCRAIASDEPASRARALARCFLLTDGQANVGEQDPERIATDAAGIRENAGIGTSTFGIGADYDESLLGPMASAGGGQFHHLRTADEIAGTFVGELGELLSVAARQVRLELDGDDGVSAEPVSEYFAIRPDPDSSKLSFDVGDLPAGEERHLVVRFAFPPKREQSGSTVRARLTWIGESGQWSTLWQELHFEYASNRECDAEAMDPSVMHWVGLHHAERAKLEATELSRRGELAMVKERLGKVARRISAYAAGDQELHAAVRELDRLAEELSQRRIDAMSAKEAHFQSLRASKGHKDLRRSM